MFLCADLVRRQSLAAARHERPPAWCVQGTCDDVVIATRRRCTCQPAVPTLFTIMKRVGQVILLARSIPILRFRTLEDDTNWDWGSIADGDDSVAITNSPEGGDYGLRGRTDN